MWLLPPPGRTVVATAGVGAVLGTAKMNPNQAGPGAHVASASYMVAAAHRGRGVGRALVAHTIDWARKAGYRGIQFNAVAASNRGAVALYEALGFAVVGTIPGGFRHPAAGYVDLLVMYRAL
jgi:GNAT superfamily N-acetyltransferase